MGASSQKAGRPRPTLGLEDLDPAILNFLSGVAATVFITFALTPPLRVQPSSYTQYAEVASWLLASVSFALAAAFLGNAKHQADMSITPQLTEEERRSIYRLRIDRIRWTLRFFLVVGLALATCGILIQA